MKRLRPTQCASTWLCLAVFFGCCNALAQRLPTVGVDLLAKARSLITAGSVDESILLLRQAIARQPKSVDAHTLLGTALSLVPKRTEAIAEFETAIRLAPASATVHYGLGLAFGRFAEPEASRKALEKAIALDPLLADAHVSLALILVQLKDLTSALAHVDRSLKLRPKAYPMFLKGKILMELERTADAAAAFERVVTLQPGNADAHLSLGIAQRKLGRDQNALASFRRSVQLAPGNAQALTELGKLYLSVGQSQEAVKQLSAANRLRPEDRPTLYTLSRALRATGKAAEAEVFHQRFKQHLKASGDNSATLFESIELNNAGVDLEKSGQHDMAMSKYRAALALDPANSGFRRNLAFCLCRLGRWKEGIAELREVLRQSPDDAEATRALYLALDQDVDR